MVFISHQANSTLMLSRGPRSNNLLHTLRGTYPINYVSVTFAPDVPRAVFSTACSVGIIASAALRLGGLGFLGVKIMKGENMICVFWLVTRSSQSPQSSSLAHTSASTSRALSASLGLLPPALTNIFT
mmetsp:Transcript_5331/g.8252  ORF Transcript_5331/g.8252 Transcript_5331/m.8252 type:complete len:128 (-) Transcript_5331:611-994(-)